MNTLKVELDITEAIADNLQTEIEIMAQRYFGGDALIYDCKGGTL